MTETNEALEYFDQLLEIHSIENSIEAKYARFRVLLETITKSLTQKEPLQFSNLFSRLSFVCEKLVLSKKIHSVRITSNRINHENYTPILHEYETHFKYLSEFISKGFNIGIPEEIQKVFPTTDFKIEEDNSTITRIKKLRVEIVEVFADKLVCMSDTSQTDEYITVKFDNIRPFTSVKEFWKGAQLYLVNIEVDDSENYYPKFVILEPDYLVDISSIAECFQDYGKTPLFYIKSKFEEVPNSKHIRLGNFANLVVDELFAENKEQQVTFNSTIKKDFQSYPFEYTTCTDLDSEDKFKEYLSNAQLQFQNIKNVIENEFSKNEVSIENSTLEPAFLCELYGIQGRLDILELSNTEKHQKIIELKSGGVPFPDNGISIKPNHATQLYLYYQLIALLKDIDFNDISTKIDGYILYSKINQKKSNNSQ